MQCMFYPEKSGYLGACLHLLSPDPFWIVSSVLRRPPLGLHWGFCSLARGQSFKSHLFVLGFLFREFKPNTGLMPKNCERKKPWTLDRSGNKCNSFVLYYRIQLLPFSSSASNVCWGYSFTLYPKVSPSPRNYLLHKSSLLVQSV